MENTHRRLAKVFPPGEYIQEDLETRDWLQSDLVSILGADKKSVSDIIGGTHWTRYPKIMVHP